MRSLVFAAAASLCVAVSATLVASATAQTAPAPSPTGIYNCPVSHIHRCVDGQCETKKINNEIEISVNFEDGTACIRRGTKCRQPRPFAVRQKSNALLLIFAQHGMVMRIDGTRFFTAAPTPRAAITFEGTCGRG